MAAHHLLQFILLLLIFMLGVAWIDKKTDDESSSEYLSMTDWPSVEDGEDDVEEDEHFISEVTAEHEGFLACRCWSTSTGTAPILETECKCRGQRISSIPSTLPTDVHRISLYNCGMEKLNRGDLQNYANTLTDFVLDKALQLITIEEGAFHGLIRLQRIYIRRAPLLTTLPDGLFRLSLPSLHILLIKQTGLRQFPNLSGLETVNILHTVDLDDNQLETIPTNSVRLRADDFLVSSNALRLIEAYAFNGSQIATLRLKGNRRLADIDPDAFMGLTSLRRLDLSQTAVTSLPVRGLFELEILELIETRSLKKIPSVYNYQHSCVLVVAVLPSPGRCLSNGKLRLASSASIQDYTGSLNILVANVGKLDFARQNTAWRTTAFIVVRLSPSMSTGPFNKSSSIRKIMDYLFFHHVITQSLQEAHLTYPYHCCAFAFPAAHDPEEHARHQRFIADMQSKHCEQLPENESIYLRPGFQGYEEFGIDISIRNHPDNQQEGVDGEVFYPNPFQTPSNRELLFHAFCGNLTYAHREVRCTPQPDAFNPCEDILGANWLRVAAWLVSVASVVGNLAVVLVLVQTSRCPMAVSKFLMVNLALADLCMGLYLFLIVGMDVNTIGVYFNYAIDWQNGIGCQVAGFLTIFATELSVFTLVVITSERWYTITYAINLTRRLRLSTTAKIVAVGWIGSLVMASLPLVGVSSFSTTSICLPLENHNLSDTIYLLLLLILNGIAFIFICLCYSHMYRSISGHNQSLASHSDATVAKRMALLVFTNFACWTPIAFFGLTAVAGYPLISVTHSKILLVFFYPLNACTNPYLYALITKQYRRDFFLLLGRYGFCTERASRYRTTFSFGRSNNNPIRAGSQLESVMQGGQLGLMDLGGAQVENSNFIRKKSIVNHSGKRIVTPPPYRSPKSDRGIENHTITVELIPLSIPTSAIPQETIIEDVKDESLVKPSNRLNIELEIKNCSDDFLVINKHQMNTDASTIIRPTVVCSSIDSPHPIKHCQIRCNRSREKVVNEHGLSNFGISVTKQ